LQTVRQQAVNAPQPFHLAALHSACKAELEYGPKLQTKIYQFFINLLQYEHYPKQSKQQK
jgi:hypothetical protein